MKEEEETGARGSAELGIGGGGEEGSSPRPDVEADAPQPLVPADATVEPGEAHEQLEHPELEEEGKLPELGNPPPSTATAPVPEVGEDVPNPSSLQLAAARAEIEVGQCPVLLHLG
jgi:hypothetical protein